MTAKQSEDRLAAVSCSQHLALGDHLSWVRQYVACVILIATGVLPRFSLILPSDTAAIKRDQPGNHGGVVHGPDDRFANRPHAHDRVDRRDIAIAGGRQRREAKIEQGTLVRRHAIRPGEGRRCGKANDLVALGPEDAEQQIRTDCSAQQFCVDTVGFGEALRDQPENA